MHLCTNLKFSSYCTSPAHAQAHAQAHALLFYGALYASGYTIRYLAPIPMDRCCLRLHNARSDSEGQVFCSLLKIGVLLIEGMLVSTYYLREREMNRKSLF